MPILFFNIVKGELPTYILSCFVPLATLMARFGLQVAEKDPVPLRISGWVNVLLGAVSIVATFIVSTLGPLKTSIRSHIETCKVFCAWGISVAWALFSWYTLNNHEKNQRFAALCLLGLVLLFGVSIPNRVMESKQSQSFIEMTEESLEPNRCTLTSSVGVVAGLAWSLKRDDIIMYGQTGELECSLNYPGAQGRFVSRGNFADWLAQYRQQGSVTLVLSVDRDEDISQFTVPSVNYTSSQGRLVLIQYQLG